MWVIYNTKRGEFYHGWLDGHKRPIFFNFESAHKFKKRKDGWELLQRLQDERIEGQFLLLRIEEEAEVVKPKTLLQLYEEGAF
jgi:hypothetical protein